MANDSAEIRRGLDHVMSIISRNTSAGLAVGHRAVSLMQGRILSGPKSGRTYGAHRASAPGESPASETGELVNGFSVTSRPGGAEVHNSAEHWSLLEYGTSKMAPRPFVGAVLAENQSELADVYARALAAEVERSGGTGGSGSQSPTSRIGSGPRSTGGGTPRAARPQVGGNRIAPMRPYK